MVKPPETLMKGKPSRFCPRLGVIPSFGSEVKTEGVSVLPLKQKPEAAAVQELTSRLVRLGWKNSPCALRNQVKRASLTVVGFRVQVCDTFNCCERVVVVVPKPGNTLGAADSKCENGKLLRLSEK